MLLVADNKCWTADRLAKRGLPHPELCPLCDQEETNSRGLPCCVSLKKKKEETINHLLLSCVFSRQIWFSVMQRLGMQVLTPQPDDHSFEDWWDQVSRRVADQAKKGLNSVVILVAWSLCNHRNRCVFYGLQPSLNELLLPLELYCIYGNWLGLEELLISSPCSLTVRPIGLLGQGLNSSKG